jgi:wyosine [tRNA(Phe)-imidazoG37] synthetase (radical SAM superfamily)
MYIQFHDIVFGPIKSRRVGTSLGVNLLPARTKICSFNCIYCECGFNPENSTESTLMPTPEEVHTALEKKLAEMKAQGESIASITFSGNGEPTLHPDFEKIIDDTLTLRTNYFPEAKVTVFSNATTFHKATVFSALNKVDNNILKFDSAIDSTLQLIDQPTRKGFTVKKLIHDLQRFNGNLIIQTIFLRGEYNNHKIDNTTQEEVSAWLLALQEIHPRQVMIYTVDRHTPAKEIYKISEDELNKIAEKVAALGINVSVSA